MVPPHGRLHRGQCKVVPGNDAIEASAENTLSSSSTSEEMQHQRYMALINGGFELGHTLLSAASMVAIAYLAATAVASLAGRYTGVSLGLYGVELPPLVSISAYLIGPGGVGVGAMFWILYRRERRMRQLAIRHLSEKTRRLEQTIDRRLSSSGLTPDGRTHPDDM